MKQPNNVKPKVNDQGWWIPGMMSLKDMVAMRDWLNRAIEWKEKP